MQIYEEGANTNRALRSKIFSNRITLNSYWTEEDWVGSRERIETENTGAERRQRRKPLLEATFHYCLIVLLCAAHTLLKVTLGYNW